MAEMTIFLNDAFHAATLTTALNRRPHKPGFLGSLGIFTPKRSEQPALNAGEVGYVVAGIKDIDGAPVGDTFTSADRPALEPLPGFQKVQPRE